MLRRLYPKQNLGIVNAIERGKGFLGIIMGVIIIYMGVSSKDSLLFRYAYSLFGLYWILMNSIIIIQDWKKMRDLYPN